MPEELLARRAHLRDSIRHGRGAVKCGSESSIAACMPGIRMSRASREGSRSSVASDYVDRIGHGTAVAAAIREKAPDAELFAVKIFHDRLATRLDRLVAAIAWCVANRMQMINLSLGTQNPAHEAALREAVSAVVAADIVLVAAQDWLPGSLPGVVPVALDWECPRTSIGRRRCRMGARCIGHRGIRGRFPGCRRSGT